MTAIFIQFGGQEYPIEYSQLVIPKYRGTEAKPIEIYGINEPTAVGGARGNNIRYNDLKKLVEQANTQAGFFDLKIIGPKEPGAKYEDDELILKKLIPLRLVRQTKQLWKLVLFDIRLLLTTRISHMDFRMLFGSKFLNGTEATTYKEAIIKVFNETPLLTRHQASDFSQLLSGLEFKKDDQHYAGLTLAQLLDALADDANADFGITNDGLFHMKDRTDADEPDRLPDVKKYSWSIEPSWNSLENIVSMRPKNFYSYYLEKHCIAIKGTDPGASVVSSIIPAELKVELEQVYLYEDEYLTLQEMLVKARYQSTAITDKIISQTLMADFQGTAIARDGSLANYRVIASIQNYWRRLWRIKYTANEGDIGGWADWFFGKINDKGVIKDTGIDCKYVEFLGVIGPKSGAFIGSDAAVNHPTPAKFAPKWHQDKSGLIVFLGQPDGMEDGSMAIPGELEAPLVVGPVKNIDDGQGTTYPIPAWLGPIEVKDKSKAKFKFSFEIIIYMVATKRMPNDDRRWWKETVEGFKDGDIDIQELQPPEDIVAYRDYVDGTAAHPSTVDGFGTLLNAVQITDDAARRVEVWKMVNLSPLEGDGEAESIAAFRDIDVTGPVRYMELKLDEHVIKTQIAVGNLGNQKWREMVAAKRLAARKYEEKGKKIG